MAEVKTRRTKADRVLEGRLRNLQAANDSRLRKAQFKRDLAVLSQVEALELVASRLGSAPDVVGPFALDELLLSITGVGRVKAEQMMKAVERGLAAVQGRPLGDPVPLSVKVRDLSPMTRERLAVVLRERAHDLS